MTETSFLLIVPFLASMTDIPCCRVPAQLSMAYKEISPFPASLALRCGALPAITASGALLLCSTPVPTLSEGRRVRKDLASRCYSCWRALLESCSNTG